MEFGGVYIAQWLAFGKECTQTTATVNVEGLGEVRLRDCVSAETIQKVKDEVIAALKIKLGQTV